MAHEHSTAQPKPERAPEPMHKWLERHEATDCRLRGYERRSVLRVIGELLRREGRGS